MYLISFGVFLVSTRFLYEKLWSSKSRCTRFHSCVYLIRPSLVDLNTRFLLTRSFRRNKLLSLVRDDSGRIVH